MFVLSHLPLWWSMNALILRYLVLTIKCQTYSSYRGEVSNSDIHCSRSGRLTIVLTKQSLYVLSKIRLLICYTFVYQSVTHILGKICKIDIKFTLFTYTILRFWTYDGLRSLEKLSLKHEDRLVSASLRACEVSFNTRRPWEIGCLSKTSRWPLFFHIVNIKIKRSRKVIWVKKWPKTDHQEVLLIAGFWSLPLRVYSLRLLSLHFTS